MYDVKMITKEDRKEYVKFNKYIKSKGFNMLQKSIYFKYIRNLSLSNYCINNVISNSPVNANIKIIKLTYNEFEKINMFTNDLIDLSIYRDNILYF